MPVLELAYERYGPFRAQMPIRVPVWLAVELKRMRRCRVQPPEWMEPQRLQDLIEMEKKELLLCTVPMNFVEISNVLFKL
jgi:GINS complex subunit 2